MATTMNPINTIILEDNEEPDALQFARTQGWPGLAAFIPRDDVGHPAVNESFSRPGVYLLVYPQPHGRYPGIYIGSSGDVANRLPQHMTTDKPWTHCYAFTSRDRRLAIQHFQFIEVILVDLAETSGSYAVHDVNRPHAPDLGERDQTIAELYLEDALRVLRFFSLDFGPFTALSFPRYPSGSNPARQSDASAASKALLRQISRSMQTEVTSIQRRDGKPNSWIIETSRGSFKVNDLQNHSRVRQECLEATNHLIPHMSRQRWDRVVQAIYDVCPQPTGNAGSGNEMRTWIAEYLASNPPSDSLDFRKQPQRPFLKDETVHIFQADLNTWLHLNHGLRVNGKGQARRLRTVGWQPVSVGLRSETGGRSTVRAWTPVADAG